MQIQMLLVRLPNFYYPTQLSWQKHERRNGYDFQNQWAIRNGGNRLNMTAVRNDDWKEVCPVDRATAAFQKWPPPLQYTSRGNGFRSIFLNIKGTIIFSINYFWNFIEILLTFSKESKGNKLNKKKEIKHFTFPWHYFKLRSVQKQLKVSIGKK